MRLSLLIATFFLLEFFGTTLTNRAIRGDWPAGRWPAKRKGTLLLGILLMAAGYPLLILTFY